MINIVMIDIEHKYMSYNLLVALKVLLFATATCEFLFTVLLHGSYKALVFSGLSSATTLVFVTIPWAICLICLALSFIGYLYTKDTKFIFKYAHYQYMFLALLYIFFTTISFVNPVIIWPVVLNYATDAVWAITILYYRYKIDKLVKADMMKLVDLEV